MFRSKQVDRLCFVNISFCKDVIEIFVAVGFIFETEIVSGEDSRFFQASLEQYVKQVRLSL